MQKIGICFMILMILVACHSIIFAQSYSVISNSNLGFYYQGMTSPYCTLCASKGGWSASSVAANQSRSTRSSRSISRGFPAYDDELR